MRKGHPETSGAAALGLPSHQDHAAEAARERVDHLAPPTEPTDASHGDWEAAWIDHGGEG